MFYRLPLSSLQEVHNTLGNLKLTGLWKILWVYNLNILFLLSTLYNSLCV